MRKRPSSRALEEARDLPGRHGLVELALLGAREVEVVLEDLLAEGGTQHLAGLGRLDRLAQRARHLRDIASRIGLSLDKVRVEESTR